MEVKIKWMLYIFIGVLLLTSLTSASCVSDTKWFGSFSICPESQFAFSNHEYTRTLKNNLPSDVLVNITFEMPMKLKAGEMFIWKNYTHLRFVPVYANLTFNSTFSNVTVIDPISQPPYCDVGVFHPLNTKYYEATQNGTEGIYACLNSTLNLGDNNYAVGWWREVITDNEWRNETYEDWKLVDTEYYDLGNGTHLYGWLNINMPAYSNITAKWWVDPGHDKKGKFSGRVYQGNWYGSDPNAVTRFFIDPEFNSMGWAYRQNITITGPFTNNTQFNLTLTEDNVDYSHINDDCSDLRIVWANSTHMEEYGIWIQECDTSGITRLWFNMTNDTKDTPNVSIYFGNPGAPVVSDIKKVFPLGDDFNICYNTTVWNVNNESNTACAMPNASVVNFTSTLGGQNQIASKTRFSTDTTEVHFRLNMNTTDETVAPSLIWGMTHFLTFPALAGTNRTIFRTDITGSNGTLNMGQYASGDAYNAPASPTPTSNAWHNVKIVVNTSGTRFYSDRVQIANFTNSTMIENETRWQAHLLIDYAPAAAYFLAVDWAFVRHIDHNLGEPTLVLEAEESGGYLDNSTNVSWIFEAIVNAGLSYDDTELNESTAADIERFNVTFMVNSTINITNITFYWRHTNGSAQDLATGTTNTSFGNRGNRYFSTSFGRIIWATDGTDSESMMQSTDYGVRVAQTNWTGDNMTNVTIQFLLNRWYMPIVIPHIPVNSTTTQLDMVNILYGNRYKKTAIGEVKVPTNANYYDIHIYGNFSADAEADGVSINIYAYNESYTTGKPQNSENAMLVCSQTYDDRHLDLAKSSAWHCVFNVTPIVNISGGGFAFSVSGGDANKYFMFLHSNSTNASHENYTSYSINAGAAWTVVTNNDLAQTDSVNMHYLYASAPRTTCFEYWAETVVGTNYSNTSVQSACWADEVNVGPEVAFDAPETNENITGTYGLDWQATDAQGDTLRFNLTLYNTDLTFYATIATELGQNGSTCENFTWNSELFPDGMYYINVTAYENDTVDEFWDSNIVNITIKNVPVIDAVTQITNFTANSTTMWEANITGNFTGLRTCNYNSTQSANVTGIWVINDTGDILESSPTAEGVSWECDFISTNYSVRFNTTNMTCAAVAKPTWSPRTYAVLCQIPTPLYPDVNVQVLIGNESESYQIHTCTGISYGAAADCDIDVAGRWGTTLPHTPIVDFLYRSDEETGESIVPNRYYLLLYDEDGTGGGGDSSSPATMDEVEEDGVEDEAVPVDDSLMGTLRAYAWLILGSGAIIGLVDTRGDGSTGSIGAIGITLVIVSGALIVGLI